MADVEACKVEEVEPATPSKYERRVARWAAVRAEIDTLDIQRADLARAISVDVRSIYRWYCGAAIPTVRALKAAERKVAVEKARRSRRAREAREATGGKPEATAPAEAGGKPEAAVEAT